MSKIIYRIYGEDTYNHETFFVAELSTMEEAEAKLKECRESVMDQCEELRDSFWIAEMTEERLEESKRQAAEYEAGRMAARTYDDKQLIENIYTLVECIKSQLRDKHLSFNTSTDNKHHDAEKEIFPKTSVCYNSITMYVTSYESGRSCISLNIYFDREIVDRGIKVFSSEQDLRKWLYSTDSLIDTIDAMEKLTKQYLNDN